MKQLDFFGGVRVEAGYRPRVLSWCAAVKVQPKMNKTMRLILEALEHGDYTADELAAMLHITAFTVRPRCSDLRRIGLIVETGEKRESVCGGPMTVWRRA